MLDQTAQTHDIEPHLILACRSPYPVFLSLAGAVPRDPPRRGLQAKGTEGWSGSHQLLATRESTAEQTGNQVLDALKRGTRTCTVLQAPIVMRLADMISGVPADSSLHQALEPGTTQLPALQTTWGGELM